MWINLISPSTCFFLIILTFPGICCSHPSFLRHVVATKFQIYFPGNSKMSLFNSWYIFCVLLWIRYSFMRFEYYYILFLLTQCIFGTSFFKHKKKKCVQFTILKINLHRLRFPSHASPTADSVYLSAASPENLSLLHCYNLRLTLVCSGDQQRKCWRDTIIQ